MNIIIGGFSDGLISLKLLHNFFAVFYVKAGYICAEKMVI